MVETEQDTPIETLANIIHKMQTIGQDLLKVSQLLKDIQKTQNVTTARVKTPKDKNKPKQPLSSFLLYSMNNRARFKEESLSVTEIAKVMGKEWHDLSEEEKQVYKKDADIDKERYKRELEQYNAGLFNPTTSSTEKEGNQENQDKETQEEDEEEHKSKKQRTEVQEQHVQKEEDDDDEDDEKKNDKDKKKKQNVLKEQHQNKQKIAILSPSSSSITTPSGSKSSSSGDSIKKPTFPLDQSKKNNHPYQTKEKTATLPSSSSTSTTATDSSHRSSDSVKKNNHFATPAENAQKDKHAASSDDSNINQPTTSETLGQSKNLKKSAKRKLKKLKRKQRQQQRQRESNVTDQQ